MSEFYDEGLTMEQASPDLNEETETQATEVIDGAPDESNEVTEAEQPEADNKPKTKRVSDRINEIRAQSDARIADLERRLEESNSSLLRYRAKEEGISEEELAARDRMEEENFRNALHNDPEFLELQQRDFERQKLEVLTQLQDSFPDDGIESLDSLPADFFRMLQVGTDPTVAYRASVADAQKPAPPSTGSVRSQGTMEGAVTTEQLEGMSTREIIDNWERIFPDE